MNDTVKTLIGLSIVMATFIAICGMSFMLLAWLTPFIGFWFAWGLTAALFLVIGTLISSISVNDDT